MSTKDGVEGNYFGSNAGRLDSSIVQLCQYGLQTTINITQCVACRIPLGSFCNRTKLSLPLRLMQYDAERFYDQNKEETSPNILQFFCAVFGIELQDTELLIHELEMCRYCSRNILQLFQLCERISRTCKQTHSCLSRLLNRLDRSPNMLISTERSLEKSLSNEESDFRMKVTTDMEKPIDGSSLEIKSHVQPTSLTCIYPMKAVAVLLNEADVDPTHDSACDNQEDDTMDSVIPILEVDERNDYAECKVEIIEGTCNSNVSDNTKSFATTPKKRRDVFSSGIAAKKIKRQSITKQIRPDTEKGTADKAQEVLICNLCDKVYSTLQQLNIHLASHESKSKCDVCGKKFKNAEMLRRHMQAHSDEYPEDFKCEDCGRVFPNLMGLQVHAVTHTRKSYTCKGCKRKFKIEKNYNHHQLTARCTEKKHACPTCGKLFKNKDKVKRHLISIHSDTKPFSCDSCGKGFRSSADLKFHEVTAHICGDNKDYQCEQCGKRFKSLDALKSHESYSHKMEKKHFCSTCGKGFPLLATLKIHEISHSTDRPYMCTYCGRTYKHFNDLRSHEVVHYKDEEKPYMCPICGSRFHRKDVLRLHQAREQHFGPDVPAIAAPKKVKIPNTAKSKPDNRRKAEEEQQRTTLSIDSSSCFSVVSEVPEQLQISDHRTLTLNSSSQLPSALGGIAGSSESENHTSPSFVNTVPRTLSNVVPAPFSLAAPIGNESITDFFRIMYDIS